MYVHTNRSLIQSLMLIRLAITVVVSLKKVGVCLTPKVISVVVWVHPGGDPPLHGLGLHQSRIPPKGGGTLAITLDLEIFMVVWSSDSVIT